MGDVGGGKSGRFLAVTVPHITPKRIAVAIEKYAQCAVTKERPNIKYQGKHNTYSESAPAINIKNWPKTPKKGAKNFMISHSTGTPSPAAAEMAKHLPKWAQSKCD